MKEGIVIHLAPEVLFTFLGVPVTNTLITTWVTVGIIFLGVILLRSSLRMVPGKVQALIEILVEYVMNFVEETLESKELARKYFPLLMTLFLFILVANIIGLLPGIDSIGIYKESHGEAAFVPLLHPVNTDLNATLAITFIVFLVIEISGVVALGFLKYAGKFVNLRSPIDFMVGIIELFSEIARLVSFSFRLFGNIFAGKVLILVVIFFVPFIVPVPLLLFELFVGFIQAAIFALLTLFFIKIAVSEPH